MGSFSRKKVAPSNNPIRLKHDGRIWLTAMQIVTFLIEATHQDLCIELYTGQIKKSVSIVQSVFFCMSSVKILAPNAFEEKKIFKHKFSIQQTGFLVQN